jgi:nitrite reductase (NADH) small subunit
MSSSKKWMRITSAQNIPLREGRSVNIAGREIAIFNLGDRFLAVDGRCPHKGGPLAEGIVTGTTVVCPLHAWKVDLESGAVKNSASPVPCIETFPTRLEAGVVLVELPVEPATTQNNSGASCDPDRPIHWVKSRIVYEERP